jgi:hypothetical protein
MSQALRALIQLADKHRDELKGIGRIETNSVIDDAVEQSRMFAFQGALARKLLLPLVDKRIDSWIDTLKGGLEAAGKNDGLA